MDFFTANLEILCSKTPDLKTSLERIPPNRELEIVPTPSGSPSALFQGISIHSRRDPVKEARTLIEREMGAGASVALFYGFGLGYLPEAFIRSRPDVPCLIIEPDAGCFVKALGARDLAAVLGHPQSVFFISSEAATVIRLLDTLDLRSVRVFKLRALYEKDRTYYERTDALIQSFLTQRDVNRRTLRRFGRLWVKNLARNVRRFCLSPGVKEIERLCAGIPALVCAGGPSLDLIAPHLHALSRRMLIIAVDTALAALQRLRLDPDITVVCDPQYWNTRHLDNVRRTGAIIIAEPSAHPLTFRRLGEHAFFGTSVFPLGRALEALAGEKGRLGAGGSVATTAWDCARHLGCAPVFMAGLDLGFPRGRTHFRGARFEEAFHADSSRLRPQEQYAYGYLHEAFPFPVMDNTGGLVLTDRRMAVYKFWFEAQMSLHSELVTYNLSQHGVRIEGMPCIGIDAALALPEKRRFIDEKLDSMRLLLKGSPDAAERVPAVRDGLVRLIRDLEEALHAARAGVHTAQAAKERLERGEHPAALLGALDEIDGRIRRLAAKEIVGFLADPLVLETDRTDGSAAQPGEGLDRSLEFYRELESSSAFHIAELKKSVAAL